MSEILVTRNLAVKWSLSVKTIYFKNSLETFQKSIPFRNIYVKYLEKNSTQLNFTAILLSFLYQYSVITIDSSVLGQRTWSSQSNTNSYHCTILSIHYLSCSCQKNKFTWTISYSNKALVTFHHDALNGLVPGINFLVFLVGSLSKTTYHWW